MPDQSYWTDYAGRERRRYLADNLAAQQAGERKRLSRLLQEWVDELERRRGHDKHNDLRRQAGLGELPYYPDPRNSTMLDSSKLYGSDLYNRLTDSRMDERNMAFPVYRENERDLLDALNVTSVSLQYDTSAEPAVDRFEESAAPLSGVNITVNGTVTDKQARLLTSWAQARFGQLYSRGRRQPAAPVAVTVPDELPVTFTERPAAK